MCCAKTCLTPSNPRVPRCKATPAQGESGPGPLLQPNVPRHLLNKIARSERHGHCVSGILETQYCLSLCALHSQRRRPIGTQVSGHKYVTRRAQHLPIQCAISK